MRRCSPSFEQKGDVMSYDEHMHFDPAADTTAEVDEASEPVRGRTRWRRFLATTLGTAVAVGAMVVLTANGVLAVGFAISGTAFTVTADRLDGQGFEQFATLDSMPDNSPNAGDTGGQIVVVVSAIGTADLTNLCQSIALPGGFLKITAGDAGTPVHATTLIVDSDEISGATADFNNISIGQDASTLTAVDGVQGGLGVFGQQADHVVITNVRQNNFATTAATFSLPHLHIGFSSDSGC
jgi:hypothetical protein